MLWGGSNPTDRILGHLAEIGAGRCTITEDAIVAEPDPDMSQVLLGLLVLHEDLTYASKQHSEADARLRAIAEERERLLEDRNLAIEARDQFLAVAAHELRTPIATLELLVDHLTSALAASAADAGSVEQLTLLKRQVERLATLVVQMLDVSVITSRGLELAPRPLDLREAVRDALDRFDLEIRQRQVAATMDTPHPVVGTWDAARVDQVVTNLLSNALKDGAGRPDRDFRARRRLTRRRQCPRSWRRHPGGRTGQGLRPLLAGHDRPVSRRPRTRPVDRAANRPGQRRPHFRGEPAGRGLDVYRGAAAVSLPLMIIDDDDDLRTALTLIMSAHGYEVAAFGDARRALGALEGGTAPFLILLDLMMAGMSGWEFRAAQLENPKLTEIPVVVLTAANTLSDGVHTLSDVEIIPKPFALDALLAVVERYAGAGGSAHAR